MSDEALETVRLDVWLWRARFFRTRTLAGEAVTRSGVRITRFGQTRRVGKPGASVAIGDVLTFTREANIECVKVCEFGTRRGPAEEARTLYEPVGESNV